MRADGPSSAATRPNAASAMVAGARVYLADPATLSKATFSCDGVFLPSSPTAATPAAMAAQQQHLYDVTCKSLLVPAPRPLERQRRWFSSYPVPTAARRIYLAYGQTASGKTYSLFGETSTSSGVEGLSPAAGVVPRYLHDVFSTRNDAEQRRRRCGTGRGSVDGAVDDVFVDLSCFEVYNEAAMDLVALSVAQSTLDFPHSTGAADVARGSVVRRLSSKTPTDAAAGVTHSLRSSDLRRQLPVWMAHKLYRSEQHPDGADAHTQEDVWGTRSESSASVETGCTATAGAAAAPFASSPTLSRFLKTEYKATEKQQVLRSLERARCTTFAEAQAVLQALLALRQECATSRNQSSSRGHLVLCVRVYAPAARDDLASEWIMQHETAFVDLAGSESGKLADADVADVCASKVACHQPRRRGHAATGAASSSRASSLHSRVSLDTSMQSGVSLQHSGISSGTTTTVSSAYHRSLLRPSPEADKKAVRVRRRRETRSINASLLALRKVFRALYEATRLSHTAVAQGSAASAATKLPRRPPLHHAPFKDSALTAILEPFLVPQPSAATPSSSISPSAPEGAAAVHVVLLVCCSSRSVDFFETIASLRLGAEAAAVKPEVVLRALPVQQRAQQHQLHLSGCATHLKPHYNTAGHRHREGGGCAACLPPRLCRSASAPSRRLVLSGDENEQGEVDELSKCTSAPGIRAASSERHDRRRPGEAVMSAADAARLCDEARQYKKTAQQLYKQCKSLCESYDECVDELQWCRAALSERDARVAELEAALEKVTRACAAGSSRQPQQPLPEPLQPRTPKASRNSTAAHGSPAARTPHPLRLQRSSREAAAGESREVIAAVNDSGKREVSADPVPSATASVTAESMRATSTNSTAREGSGRWMVSVSPFSTASLAEGTAARMATVREDVEGVKDVVDDAGSSGSSILRQSCDSSVERQQQHARRIMDTLLARQIFPSDEPVEPTQSLSPPCASSPYPVLPTLSARGTAAPASSPVQEQQHARSHSSCQDSESDAHVAQGRESDSDGRSPLTAEADAAAGEPARAKEVAEASATVAAASASMSAPRQSYNTPRSSSAGATASSLLEGRGSVSVGRSSCYSVAEGPEVELMAFLSSAATAVHGVTAPVASASAVSATAPWSKEMNVSVSHTVPRDSPLRATTRRVIAMSMDRDREVPHAEAAVGGDEEDAVEEVVIRLKKQDRSGALRIPAATCQPTETIRHVEVNGRAASKPPCSSPPLGAVSSAPVPPSASPLGRVYQL
ncbi:putative kinesin [Leishmania major strain Friedlin]|uniref:Putative kinesin n=1 Tax=Leishmania major TaxID=5664 RepID=Q4QHZ7_LEIMA|nr:putative kinesin [Leishmania major strain Friedlin]CAG9569632.1 kinesin_-__putative [Leishmania major strain Friedlin]CAJ02421.1 putative kinesin [Leishmania major strain Friedlin]|eukprot:XP_001681201.1 putative kinesin [Leishmania major strain Friedlin]